MICLGQAGFLALLVYCLVTMDDYEISEMDTQKWVFFAGAVVLQEHVVKTRRLQPGGRRALRRLQHR